MYFIKLGKFSSIIFSNIISSLVSLFFLWDSYSVYVNEPNNVSYRLFTLFIINLLPWSSWQLSCLRVCSFFVLPAQICYWINPVKFLRFYLFIFSDGGGREKDRKRNINVRENHRSVASCAHHNQGPCSDWGPNLQPTHVSLLGIELATFNFAGWHPTKWAILVRAVPWIFNFSYFTFQLLYFCLVSFYIFCFIHISIMFKHLFLDFL